jgi:nucleotide-binding universal stress UspA family protein
MMFKNVIVGVDGTQNGCDAIALASRLLAGDGELTLAHVYEAPRLRAAAEGMEDDPRLVREQFLARERALAHVDAQILTVMAPTPGHGLHVLAEQRDADLLVVGSCSRSAAGQAMLGNNTRAALNGAPCAVAIAARGYAERKPIARVGVAYNRSRESEGALAMAHAIALSHRSSIHLLQVVPVMERAGDVAACASLDDDVQSLLQRAEDHMSSLPSAEGRAVYGLIGEELAEFGRKLDLLLVGSRGYGPIGRVMLGNTTNFLERRGGCSLLVLTRSPAFPADARPRALGQAIPPRRRSTVFGEPRKAVAEA